MSIIYSSIGPTMTMTTQDGVYEFTDMQVDMEYRTELYGYNYVSMTIQRAKLKSFTPHSHYKQLEHNEYVSFIDTIPKKKEETKMNNFMNGMFGKVKPGMCRLSMSGGIAVMTSGGDYKSYNMKTGRLTNCSNFVFDIGEDFFFVIPTNKVEKGDIILVSGKPRCVIGVEDNKITVINYDDSTVDTILPERHVFMGSTYFYGKIVSMFGNDVFKGAKGTNKIIKYMMMSEMMKGGSGSNGFGNMLPFMMMGGGNFDNMFDGMFDFDMDDEDATDVEDADAEDKED